jgi:hypothetical protein
MGLPLNGFDVVVPIGRGASLVGTLLSSTFLEAGGIGRPPIVTSGLVRWRPGPTAPPYVSAALS